jgi:ATP-binding cassette, subfamily B, bacterial MsbA
MKHFFRSLRYLRPYRIRLVFAVLAAVLIAVLWGGGLTMILPGAKVLFSAEGLHGWAWRTMAQDRLNARLIQRTVPPKTTAGPDGPALSIVVDVVEADRTGRAFEGGVRDGDWLVGLSEDGSRRYLRADVLLQRLADWGEADRIVDLLVYDPAEQSVRNTKIKLHRLRSGSRLMGRLGRFIPNTGSPEKRFPIFVWLLLFALVITLVRNVLRVVQEYLVQTSVHRGLWDLRMDCYNVALRQPVTYFASAGTSDTASRFVRDATELAQSQITLFGKTLVEPAKMIASILAAFLLSWQLTLLAMLGGPFAYLLIRTFGKRMRRSTKRALESFADMLAILEETLQGIRVVKAYTMEAAERRRFNRVNRALYRQQRRMARIDSATSPTVEALGISAGLVAAGVAGYWVFGGQMDPETFMTVMVLLAAMFDPVRKLSKVVVRFQTGDAAAERLFEIRDQAVEKRTPGSPMLPRHCRDLLFEGVRYTYPNAPEPAVRDVDLTCRSGQTVAIVGPNGSGKTTLVSLLPRLIEPDAGRILLDGADIATHSLRSLRRQIAYVTQETVLFNATIAENISYGLRRPKRDGVLAAAKRAFVDEFVDDLPDGFDTMVGQRGATLSGGQRQRIAIARAILRDPAILIFDEAMSQIDADSEHRIHQAMEEFVVGRTTLMIAHRFSTVLSADAIVVMDAGRIVDQGTHNDLLNRCDLYRQLYQTQFARDPDTT